MYALWEKMLIKGENGNVLDGTGRLPIRKVAPIGKSTLLAYMNFRWPCSLKVY
jgi:hypothetical protein